MTTEKVKVLVVDDEKELSILLAFLLVEYGFQADRVFDGESALMKLREGGFAYVISDVRMPKMNGVELFKAAQAELSPTPRFVFITGFEDILGDYRNHEQVIGVFHKPIDHEQLVSTIREDAERPS